MWRTFSLALLLAGCSNSSDQQQAFNANWDNVRQDSDIADLNRKVADLQKQDDVEDNAITALTQDQAELHHQIDANAKIANDNGNMNDRRWDYIRQKLPQ